MKILEIILIKTSSETVKARADIHFEGFTLKGFKVLQDQETKKEYVTAPSYKAGPFWRPLFKTDIESDWEEIQRAVLQEFNRQQIEESLADPNR